MTGKVAKVFYVLAIVLLVCGIITVGIGTAYLFFNAIPAEVFHWSQTIYLSLFVGYQLAKIIVIKKSRK